VTAAELNPLNVAVVGCGNIADAYGRTLRPYPQLRLLGATSRTLSRAEEFVANFGGKVYPSLEAVLADDDVDLVINLTIHSAHVEIISQCLRAGKHVYSEKPIALSTRDAWDLVALAQERGRRLGSAPITILGEAQQTAWKAIRDGLLGTVRVAYAEVNWGRIESWHPAPAPFYQVGPLFDVAVYPLTILTTIFGPARSVTAFGKVLYPDRVTRDGTPFSVTTPDFAIAAVEFASGAVARLTANFYVGFHSRQRGIEFHGDRGSLFLGDWHDFNGTVEYAGFDGTWPDFDTAYQPIPYVREPYGGDSRRLPGSGVEWSRGVVDMAEAIRDNRPQRISGEQAAHVVEIVSTIHQALRDGCRLDITSDFPPPVPMAWADQRRPDGPGS
jgi:predicted dehydrogenase